MDYVNFIIPVSGNAVFDTTLVPGALLMADWA